MVEPALETSSIAFLLFKADFTGFLFCSFCHIYDNFTTFYHSLSSYIVRMQRNAFSPCVEKQVGVGYDASSTLIRKALRLSVQ